MPKLLEEVRDLIRTRHYSYRTEEAYLYWIRQYILFHGKRHPAEMGPAEVSKFLTHLAVNREVAASTIRPCRAAVSLSKCAQTGSAWTLKDGKIELAIEVLANKRATVRLPKAQLPKVTESGQGMTAMLYWPRQRDVIQIVVEVGSWAVSVHRHLWPLKDINEKQNLWRIALPDGRPGVAGRLASFGTVTETRTGSVGDERCVAAARY
jgi:hypothetical protein